MSKAILILDMPSCCDECDIKGIFCGDVGDNDMCRAGGCPLKKVPQRKGLLNQLPMYDTDTHYEQGYNACIDDILKGSEENG